MTQIDLCRHLRLSETRIRDKYLICSSLCLFVSMLLLRFPGYRSNWLLLSLGQWPVEQRALSDRPLDTTKIIMVINDFTLFSDESFFLLSKAVCWHETRPFCLRWFCAAPVRGHQAAQMSSCVLSPGASQAKQPAAISVIV